MEGEGEKVASGGKDKVLKLWMGQANFWMNIGNPTKYNLNGVLRMHGFHGNQWLVLCGCKVFKLYRQHRRYVYDLSEILLSQQLRIQALEEVAQSESQNSG